MDSMQLETPTPSPGFPTQPQAHAQDHYTDRLPSPPHIQVLPPKDYADPRLPTHLIGPNNIFAHIALNPTTIPLKAWGEWAYGDRRVAQPILPFLYIGPLSAVKDHSWLKEAGITLIVNARHIQVQAPGQRPTSPLPMPPALAAAEAALPGFQLDTRTIDIRSNADLASSFTYVNGLITSHFARNAEHSRQFATTDIGKALIVCESGNERSAALATAYLLEITDLTLVEACQLVQNQRFAVNVDDSLKWTLKAFEDYLAAKRMVDGSRENERPQPVRRQSILCNIPAREDPACVKGHGSGGRRSSTKRGLDEVDDGDEEMEWGNDDVMAGADGRDGGALGIQDYLDKRARNFAPFKTDG